MNSLLTSSIITSRAVSAVVRRRPLNCGLSHLFAFICHHISTPALPIVQRRSTMPSDESREIPGPMPYAMRSLNWFDRGTLFGSASGGRTGNRPLMSLMSCAKGDWETRAGQRGAPDRVSPIMTGPPASSTCSQEDESAVRPHSGKHPPMDRYCSTNWQQPHRLQRETPAIHRLFAERHPARRHS